MANVLITGSSSGFGYLTALELARHGDRVFATMRNPAATPQLAEIAAVEKLRLSLHTLDVDDSASVQQAVDEITGQAVRYVPASAAASVMNSPRAIAAQNVCTTSVTIRSENLAIATSDQPPPKVDETHEPQDPPAQQPRSAPIAAGASPSGSASRRPGRYSTTDDGWL